MAIRYGITVKVYDACAHRWIVNGTADPKEERVFAIRWDRLSTHYDLLIPEEDDFALNRSRQLRHILSRCSLQSRDSRLTTPMPKGKSQCTMRCESQFSQEDEEVEYGLSSSE